jgi:hypothetical protein
MIDAFKKNCPIDVNITAKDRKRLHGAGIKSFGFIEKVFEIAKFNPNFAPRFLDVKLLDEKFRNLKDIMSLKDVLAQFSEFVKTAFLLKSDDCYRDASEYYFTLQEAAKRKVPQAPSLFNELKPFFHHKKKRSDKDTETDES